MPEPKSRPFTSTSRGVLVKCVHCEIKKPVWYFGIKPETGDRRKICKACRALLKHRRGRVHPDKRFKNVFDGLDVNITNLNFDREAQDLIAKRAEAIKTFVLQEMQNKDSHQPEFVRTIVDEIRVGKRAWRSIFKLAIAPMPLDIPYTD